MKDWWSSLMPFLTAERVEGAIQASLLLILGFVLAGLLARLARRVAEGRLEAQQTLLLRRGVYYLTLSLFVAAALREIGVDLGIFLGAAGILTVAIGFASQTSASNLVSGLFLIAEKPFAIGDVIQIGGTTGEVLSIDLLAVKLRTFDNLFVRVPNETLVKSEVRTLTKFPIRRADLKLEIAYKEDVERVRDLLFDLADRNPLCLDEPKPLFLITGFAQSGVELQFSPWALRENFVDLRNGLQSEIKAAFEAAGIEIPYPHRVLVTATGSPRPPLAPTAERPNTASGS